MVVVEAVINAVRPRMTPNKMRRRPFILALAFFYGYYVLALGILPIVHFRLPFHFHRPIIAFELSYRQFFHCDLLPSTHTPSFHLPTMLALFFISI